MEHPLTMALAAALALMAGGLGTVGGASWLLACAAAAAGIPAALALTALKLQGLCGDAAVVAMSLHRARSRTVRRETARQVLRAAPAGALAAAGVHLGPTAWACTVAGALALLLGSRIRLRNARFPAPEAAARLALATYVGALGFAATSLHVACSGARNAEALLARWHEAKCVGCGANLGAALLLALVPGTVSPILWILLALQGLGALAGAHVMLSFRSHARAH